MFEDSEKDKGNAAFRRQDFEGALMHYNRAITNAGSGATADLFANKAAAQLNLEQYDSCSRQCLKALAAPGLTPALEAKIRSRSKSACEAQMKLLEAFKEEFKKCEVGPKGIKQMADLLPMMSKGENPTERRANVISEYDQLVERCKNDRGESKVLFAALLHGESSRVCNALLSDLKPIAIDQLRLHETSVGKVLICRTIVEPIKLSALGVLVEDPNGDVMRVAVYNFCSSSDDLNAVLPAGTYLAIKEPCYTTESTFSLSAPTLSFSVVPVDEDEHPKRGSRSKQNHGTSTSELPVAANNGKPAIRVDNPADLVYLDQNHFLLNKVAWRTAAPVKLPASPRCADSWESLQRRGNELFVAGKYELAVVAYTDAIELKRKVAPQEEVADLLANRAAAYLGDDRPIDALWDCRSALFVQPGHLKATLRMARAHACLAAYGDAKAVLEKSPHTTRPEVKAEISRLDRLIREQQLGDYELKSLLNEAAASQAPRLDHADFNGGVAMQWISEEKGNGLVATRDFAPGELLFVSKAIEATYRSECDVQVSIKGYKFHADEEVVKRKTQNECASRIIRKVSKNKDLAKQLYRLYAGPEFERFDDTGDADGPAIDPKRIAAIVSFSAIACGEFQSNAKSDTGIGDFPDFDKVRFGFSFRGCGVWPVASFMNHSCAPNSIVFFVGDLLLVRAATPIRKGDELTTSYVCSASTYTQRQELLNERFGFNCECELCLCDLERAFDQPDLEDQREAFERSQVATKSIVERFSMFPSLYGYKDRYDQLAQRWCKALGIYYIGTQEWLKAAGAWEMAYAATVGDGTDTGDTFRYNAMQSDAVFLCFNIANSYLLGMDFAKTKEYVGKMQEAARIAWGGAVDEEFLVILYPHLELPILDLFSCLRKGTAFIKANNTSCEELLRMT